VDEQQQQQHEEEQHEDEGTAGSGSSNSDSGDNTATMTEEEEDAALELAEAAPGKEGAKMIDSTAHTWKRCSYRPAKLDLYDDQHRWMGNLRYRPSTAASLASFGKGDTGFEQLEFPEYGSDGHGLQKPQYEQMIKDYARLKVRGEWS